eukprot:11823230-Alexandrium_andersonii.AAC.1
MDSCVLWAFSACILALLDFAPWPWRGSAAAQSRGRQCEWIMPAASRGMPSLPRYSHCLAFTGALSGVLL